MESIGDSAEELHSVEGGKRICEVLCSRPGVRVMSPEYWMYECKVIWWEWFLNLLCVLFH